MKLRTDIFDLWIFHRNRETPEYLLFHTSREKADTWFHGGQFWQIPGGFTEGDEEITDAVIRVMGGLKLEPAACWAAECTYTYYNPRRKNIEIVPVFAAEIPASAEVEYTWEHDKAGWFTAAECLERLYFRGLKDGLTWTREYITEGSESPDSLRIF